ncbi:MAG: hypothetical protein AABY22_11605, partial [Nanoarchaeota archaeon]
MTYAEKLKNPKWQKLRLKILERDNFQCQNCLDNTKTLHVHHLDYINGKEPWDYPNEYLLTLCEKCHEDVKQERQLFENNIIKQSRLKLKDTFIQDCTSSVFTGYENLHDLFYLLWELKDYQNEVDDVLSSLWHKKKNDFFILNS